MTKFKIDLRDFLQTGEFGPIRLGMTKKEVEGLFGKPQDWGGSLPWKSNKQRGKESSYYDYPIWKYDDMEFHFGDEGQRAFLIFCDSLYKLKNKGDVFYLDRWVFEMNPLTLEQVEQALVEEGIDYIHKKLEYFGALVFASGTKISYEYDDSNSITAIENYGGSYVGMPSHLSQDTK